MRDVPLLLDENSLEGIVTILHATKTFGGKIALDDVSFSIPGGQICGLLVRKGL